MASETAHNLFACDLRGRLVKAQIVERAHESSAIVSVPHELMRPGRGEKGVI